MATYTKPQSDCNDYGHRAVGSGQGSGQANIPYTKAFDIIKDYYMFMHEDDDATAAVSTFTMMVMTITPMSTLRKSLTYQKLFLVLF